MSDLLRLFKSFKSKYHTAVVKDEALGNDESGSWVKEKKAREAWAEANQAESEFFEAFNLELDATLERIKALEDAVAGLTAAGIIK